MSKEVTKIAIFKGKKVRRVFKDEQWWFSVIDVCEILTNSVDAGAYWRKLKQRLKEEGSEVVTFCHGLKLEAPDGKMREGVTFGRNLRCALRHGKGFSQSNIYLMRQFFISYPKFQTSGISHALTWSHYCELLNITDEMERQFYEVQCVKEKWSIREFKRQKDSSLFLRLAASKDKDAILKLAAEGQVLSEPKDILRDPYVFEFLKISEPYLLSEKELETRLCDHLQQFLLELGKGFAFVGRQYRITLNNEHFYIDLVFYHRYLKCYVLVDLKVEKLKHHDIGQMNMYLGYFANEENIKGDNPPIGIILTRHKDELLVEYATYQMNSQLFVSKYQLYLPDQEELRRELELTLREAGNE